MSFSDVQFWVHDFFQSVNFTLVFGSWVLDYVSGSAVAIHKRCWNSQMATRGLAKLLRLWIPVLILSYFARKSGAIQGTVLAVALESYAFYVNFGSALENVGIINNDQTLTIAGRALHDKGQNAVMLEDSPK